MTTINELRNQLAAETMRQICKQLRWTQEEYAGNIYNTGMSYLDYYLPADEHARRQLERSKMFWSWFRNMWATQDSVLLNDTTFEQMCLADRVEDYYNFHNPQALAEECKPNKMVLQAIKTATV